MKNWLANLRRRLRRPPLRRLVTIEVANVCNLRCAYCFRDEEMLYGKAQFLDLDAALQTIDSLAAALGPFDVAFTGGEPSLHPEFSNLTRRLAERKIGYRFVTNGWHFERIAPALTETLSALQVVAFSVDGVDRSAHDSHRGAGSFDRLMKAVATCRARKFPFQFNVVLRRDTGRRMEAFALLAARLGAQAVNFGSLLPTSVSHYREHSLTPGEEREALRECAELSRILRIPARVSLPLYNPRPGAHCLPLAEKALNLDYRGRLTLCANLSSFRGPHSAGDVPPNGSVSEAVIRLRAVGAGALAQRDGRLRAASHLEGSAPNRILASPCLSCLDHFGKLDPALASMLRATE